MNSKGNWEVTIRKVRNGFICKYEEELEADEGFHTEEILFEMEDTEDGELENMKEVLWWIKDHFGIHWDKYKEKNLNIKIEEDKDEK